MESFTGVIKSLGELLSKTGVLQEVQQTPMLLSSQRRADSDSVMDVSDTCEDPQEVNLRMFKDYCHVSACLGHTEELKRRVSLT